MKNIIKKIMIGALLLFSVNVFAQTQTYSVQFSEPYYIDDIRFVSYLMMDSTKPVNDLNLFISYDTSKLIVVGHNGGAMGALVFTDIPNKIFIEWHTFSPSTSLQLHKFIGFTFKMRSSCCPMTFDDSSYVNLNNIPYQVAYHDTIFCRNVAGIDENSNEFNYYPTPAVDFIYFNKLLSNIKIYSPSGVLIQSYNDVQKINIQDLQPGLYFAILNNKTTIKIVKE